MSGNVLFQGSKTFWRQRATLDILIVEHASVDHTSDYLEVVSYDSALNMEAPRMYLKTRQLVDCISAQEIASRVDQGKNDASNEEDIKQRVIKELLIKYVESKIVIDDYSFEEKRVSVSLLPSFDSSKNIDVAVEAPEHITPFTYQHSQQIYGLKSETSAPQAREDLEKMCKLEKRVYINARWKLPLIAIRLKSTKARSDGPETAIDDAFVQENTAFAFNSADAATLLVRQQEAAERARAEGKAVHSSHIGGLELREASYEHQMTIDHLDQQTKEKKLAVLAAIKNEAASDVTKVVDATAAKVVDATAATTAAGVAAEGSPDSPRNEAAPRRHTIDNSNFSTHSRGSQSKTKMKRSSFGEAEDSSRRDNGVPVNWDDDCGDAAGDDSKRARLKQQPPQQQPPAGATANSFQEMVQSFLRWGVERVIPSATSSRNNHPQQVVVTAGAGGGDDEGSFRARVRDKPAAATSSVRKNHVSRNLRSSNNSLRSRSGRVATSQRSQKGSQRQQPPQQQPQHHE